MISIDEIKRLAGSFGVMPTVIDHDYVIGCYLHYLAIREDVQSSWVFKGGTALRKCYFEKYRFSEDIDFTVMHHTSKDQLRKLISKVNKDIREVIGIRADVGDFVIEVIEDDYGKESFEAKIYYQGSWDYGGSHRSLRIHINCNEKIIFEPNQLEIFHSYSDRPELPNTTISVYKLEEFVVEKLRAIAVQRRWAIARDIYDIYYLSRENIDIDKITAAFPDKCGIKGINTTTLDIQTFAARRKEYEMNWKRNLEHLVPNHIKVDFNEAWETSFKLLKYCLGKNKR